jgi:hypothetical protein
VACARLHLYFIKLSPIDNQSKGGDFDRRRKLRVERCIFLRVIFGAGGGIVSFLKSTDLPFLQGYKSSNGNLRFGLETGAIISLTFQSHKGIYQASFLL